MAESQQPPKTPSALPPDDNSPDKPIPVDGATPEAPPPDPLAEARTEAARLKEVWMRTAADYDNYRKRARRELEDARKAGREELLKDLLPVFDNLERGIQSAQQAADVKAVTDGLGMI